MILTYISNTNLILNKIIIAPIEKLRQNRSTKELNPNTEIFEPVVQNA